MTRLALVTLLLAACGSSSSKDARDICQRAADRYVQCVGEVLGEEAKAMVSAPGKDGRAQCERDERTVDAYRVCLPKASCDAFMDCVLELAMQEP